MNGCWGRIFVWALIALGSCTGAFAAGINTDAVNELTPDAGVTVDSVVIKDGKASGAATSLSDAGGTLVTKDYVGIPRVGTAHIVVQTTDVPATNGANLLAAYTAAKALTPNGAALSATNRAVVLVSPGNYDLGTGQLTLDAEGVDLVGLSTARANQYLYGASNGAGTGVLAQTADNVHIENLLIHCTRAAGGVTGIATDPAAYFPNGALANTIVRNCEFRANDTNAWSMRVHIEYKGSYTDCTAGNYSFGSLFGMASGTFTNCAGGYSAFGGNNSTASGVFTNCTGGVSAFGGSGTASGTFANCTGGQSAFGGAGGMASGAFTNCTGGQSAFGGSSGTASGTFTNCTGGQSAFGGGGTASGAFIHCAGEDLAFGSMGTAPGGKFYQCVSGAASFTESGTPAPVQLFCIQNGAQYPGNN